MTRFLPLTFAWLVLLPLVAGGQTRYQPRGYPNPNCAAPPACETPPPTCAAEPNCAVPPPCKPPCKPEQPLMYMQPPPQGVFVQPPASGTVQGPVEQRGIEGATVTFPEMSLKFPSIRFPGMSRTRQNARMITDSQNAPWQEMPAAPMMPMAPAAPVAAAPQMMPVQQAPQMMMAQAAPQMMMMAAPQMMMAPVQMAPQQYMPQQYMPQQQYVPQPAAQPMQAPQPPPEEPPQAPRAPSCDARGNPLTTNAAEERIRQLELVEQQLKQRMELLRRQLEQVEMSGRPPTPSPDLGARAVQPPAQLPAAQPLRQPGVQPISQPVVQPGQAAVRVYHERPARYISEPEYLPPAPQTIREPQSPTAMITGLRLR